MVRLSHHFVNAVCCYCIGLLQHITRVVILWGKMNKQWFLALMEARRMSMRGLAQKMGLQHTQLSLTFSGQRKMQLEEAAQLSQLLGVPLTQVAINAGVPVRFSTGRRVHVIGFVGKDGAITFTPGNAERTEASCDMPDDVVAVQCRTAATPLEFCDGWVVFFRQADLVDPECVGRTSYVKLKSGSAGIATVHRGYQPGTYNLSGIMERHSVALESASPILLIRP